MCVYGGDNARHFDCALKSVIGQTALPSEIVLTVDGSIPADIEQVIGKYQSLLAGSPIDFNVIYLKDNKGHGEARRICLDHCRQDLIALMDADDISESYRFEKQLDYLAKHPEVSIVGGQITEFVSLEDPEDASKTAGRRTVPETDAEIKKYMRQRCPMNQVTVMFRAQDVKDAGGYLDWFCEEDYYLWIRMARKGYCFGNIPETLVKVRVGEDMYNRRGGIRYFQSEAGIQGLMLKSRMISLPVYLSNCAKRLVVQVLLPNSVRGWVFRQFARN